MKNNRILALLVDDEPHALGNLSHLITQYCPQIEVCGLASSVGEARVLLREKQPDVLFLDIQMPGETGFDLVGQLDYVPLLVFVTAFDQYAIRALKFSAIDYLLKPVDLKELMQVADKLGELLRLSRLNQGNFALVLKQFNLLRSKRTPGDSITLPAPNGYEVIPLSQIIYLEADNNYSRFYLLNSREILVAKTLKDYEETLVTSGFIRIHKSYLINKAHARSVHRKDQHFLEMSTGVELAISRRKLSELLATLQTR